MSNAQRRLVLPPETQPEVADALRYAFNALEDHNQAFRATKDLLDASPTTASVQQLIAASKAAPATTDLNMSGFRILNLGTPISPTDAATKAYVDGKLILFGTHATRLTTNPNIGAWFVETDRSVAYAGKEASGTVSTNGTAITWLTGDKFSAAWVNSTVVINGVATIVSAFNSETSLTVADNMGVNVSVSYSSSIGLWIYVAGIYIDAIANRPSDLLSADSGFIFYATDRGYTWRWSGTTWIIRTELGIALEGTHAVRIATGTVTTAGTGVTWVSGDKFDASWTDLPIIINGVQYTVQSVTSDSSLVLTTSAGVQVGVTYLGGTFSWSFYPGVGFYETDRKSAYVTANASGTVSTAGTTTITWVSGDKFDSRWVGATIVIDGTSYTVTAVASGTSATVNTAIAASGSRTFSVQSGKWTWVSGLYVDTFSNRPADLGLTDVGFMFAASDQNNVVWRWDGAAFKYWIGLNTRTQAQLAALAALLGANDTGYIVKVTDYFHILAWTGAAWTFQEGDGSGQVVIGNGSSAPNGGLWGLCDGTTYAVLNANGTTTNVATQNLTGDVFIKGAATAGTQQTATTPKWIAGAKTDLANTGASVTDNTVAVQSGSGTTVVQSTTFNEGNHQHNLSDANATLNAPSEANGGLPLRIACTFWIRR